MIQDNNENATNRVDDEVGGDGFENPVLTKYQTSEQKQRWQRNLQSARDERKHTDAEATRALERYRDKRSDNDDGAAYYNLFFANADIKKSAVFGRVPAPDVKRRFNDPGDEAPRVAANILQRNLVYELETGNFEGVFNEILFDRYVPGMGVGWVRLHTCEVEQPPLIDPITGIQFPQPPVTTGHNALIDHVHWDDFFWAPCRSWSRCPWVARRIGINEADAKARFGKNASEEVLKQLVFTDKPAEDMKGKLTPQYATDKEASIYEIWDKENGVIFWYADECDLPLDVQADTNGFDNFFPTPLPPLARFDTSNTQPISDYSCVKGKYKELDRQNQKSVNLGDAMSVKFLYNGAIPEIQKLYTEIADNEGVAVEKWDEFMGDDGIASHMQFAPLEPVSNALVVINNEIERVKDQIAEVEGISDIARGQSGTYETATATNAKSALSSGRLQQQQSEVAHYAEKLIQLKAHMMAKFYPPQLLMQRAGQMNPVDQQWIMPALQLLQNSQLSSLSLSVSIDSLQAINWANDQADLTQLIGVMGPLLQQSLPVIQTSPAIAPVLIAIMKKAVASFRGGQDLEGMFDQLMDSAMQQAQQAQAAPQQPKPPSPEQIKANTAQMKAQTDLQISQGQEQTKLQIANAEIQSKNQIEAQKAQIDTQTLRIRQLEAMVAAKQIDNQQHADAVQHAHNASLDIIAMGKPPGGGQ